MRSDYLHFLLILSIGVVLLITFHFIFVYYGSVPTLMGEFFGADTYNRMSRARELFLHGQWFDSRDLKISPPEGFLSHWSRPLDGAIVGFAYLLDFFMPSEKALFWAGSLVSPILHLLSFVVALLILRPCFSPRWLENVPIVFVFCFPIFQAFYTGRPDHNAPMIAVLWIVVALSARVLIFPSRQTAFLLGVVTSLMTWIVASGFLAACAVSAGFGLLWCLYGKKYLLPGLSAHAGIVVGLFLWLVLERGVSPDLLFVLEGDRLSFLHASLMLLPFIFWFGAFLISRYSACLFKYRLLTALGSSVVMVAVLLSFFPDIKQSEVLNTDPYYAEKRGQHIAEYDPVISEELIEDPTIVTIGNLVRYSWVYFAGLLSLFIILYKSKNNDRPIWIYLLVLWALPTLYFWQQYFGLQSAHMAMFSVILILPLCELLDRVLRFFDGMKDPWRTTSRVSLRLAIIAIGFGSQAVMVAAARSLVPADEVSANAGTEPKTSLGRCIVSPVKKDLESAFAGDSDLFLMALPELSGMLRYHLDAAVFAIGQHRYQPGFRDMHEIFSSTDMKQVEQRLAKHGVDGVVVCASPKLGNKYFLAESGDDYLYVRLRRGEPPAFLEEIPLDYPALRAFKFK